MKNPINLPKIAEPTIEQVLEEFLAEQMRRLKPGKLWLKVYTEKGKNTVGPIAVPKEATGLLREGWDISCAIARVRGKWKIVEVANVYPL